MFYLMIAAVALFLIAKAAASPDTRSAQNNADKTDARTITPRFRNPAELLYKPYWPEFKKTR